MVERLRHIVRSTLHAMALDPTHPDYWTQVLQFTETVHRDVYPAIEPTDSKMRQIANSKVVVVTGAGAKSIVLATRAKASIDNVPSRSSF